MLTLVTVIYGDDRRFKVELFGSVLSILKLRRSDETQVVVYTDRPLEGFPLPITERIISPDEWQEWTRGSGITHLVKLHLVRQTLQEKSGPVIYFDTDTLFLVPPEVLAEKLSPATALMHADEGPIANHELWSKIAKWLGEGREVCGQILSGQSVMYNSGIIGVVPEHVDALRRSVDIADALYAVDPVFSLDQFSTGSALSREARVNICEQEILHYWGWNRPFIRDAIDDYWRTHANRPLAELCDAFDPLAYERFPPIHWRDKLQARFAAFRWKLNGDGRFACIALAAALRHGATNPDDANRWFTVHMEFVAKQQSQDEAAAERLIRAFSQDYEVCRSWLSSENAQTLETRFPEISF